ncbi:DUF2510 domain-containing protein [Arthrobacter citreus]|jgi:hypothetical protein|uniref:DUF2510 domain-containing protein n=1 Tax=Arthrobacter citreus TaxID=1670 RepID=A0ABZ2ZZS5_9MICC
MSSPLPGWYQDPTNPDQQKWWDGQNWSMHTMPLAPAEPSGSGAPTAGDPSENQPGPETAAVPQAPAFGDAGGAAQDLPSYPGNQGYPGGQQQAYPTFQPPAQPQSYAVAAAADGQQDYPEHQGYQGYPQGYAGQPAAYPGYPGYQGYPGYGQKPLRSNPLALTGFILGIVSFFMFFIPIVGSVISLAAGAFSAIGLSNQSDRAPVYKVFGIIGLILGVIFTLLSVLILALIFSDPYSY